MKRSVSKLAVKLKKTVSTLTQKKPEGAPAWVNQVAMLTGALAALAGFLTVRSTVLTNEAIYESNQAILSQTQASDTWAEYQANSIKARIVEVQMLTPTLGAATQAKLEAMDKDLREREPKLKQAAADKETARDNHLGTADKQLGEKDILGYAGMAAQLGIALASVAALVHRRPIFYAGIGAGVVGVLLTAYTFLAGFLAGS